MLCLTIGRCGCRVNPRRRHAGRSGDTPPRPRGRASAAKFLHSLGRRGAIRNDRDMADQVRNVHDALDSFSEHWQLRRLASVNDYDVKVVKLLGEFTWHSHPETDELFMVLSGGGGSPPPARDPARRAGGRVSPP